MKIEGVSLHNVSVSKRTAAGCAQKNATSIPVAPSLLPVLLAVASKKLDKWKIVAYSDGDRCERIDGFNVYEDGEKLGNVYAYTRWRAASGNTPIISVTSPRIHKDRSPRDSVETKDSKLAIRTVMKYFIKKSIEERMSECCNDARTVLMDVSSQANRAVSRHLFMGDVGATLPLFIVDKLPELKRHIAQHAPAVDLTALDGLTAVVENKSVVDSVASCDVVVLVEGSLWRVKRKNLAVETVAPEDAPEWMRRKVSMLKLVEDTQAIKDVGIRVTEKIYYILGE